MIFKKKVVLYSFGQEQTMSTTPKIHHSAVDFHYPPEISAYNDYLKVVENGGDDDAVGAAVKKWEDTRNAKELQIYADSKLPQNMVADNA